ncbi:MAG: SRPBCC family protein [Bacteroidota bacterium]
MKNISKLSMVALLLFTSNLFLSETATAQSEKKRITFQIERTIEAPAADIWQVIGEDFGLISKSHPLVVRSEYTEGALKGALGTERLCYFKENGSQMLREKIVAWKPEQMEFDAAIREAKKFPVDTDVTLFTMRVTPLTSNQSKLEMIMNYRTKPAFMGGMLKGSFTKRLEDYLLAVEHYVLTGEAVTVDNFKEIKKSYTSR